MTDKTIQTNVRATLRDSSLSDEGPWRFHGVVIENEEVTNGSHGKKRWPAAELEKAAGQLSGLPVVNGHSYDSGQPRNEDVVGKVTADGYDPSTGWLYEMEVGDAELAQKLHHNHLEVSFHGAGRSAGETDDGIVEMSDISARDLAIVPLGGASGNTVNPGSAPDTSPVAAMSAADIATQLGSDTPTTDEQPDDDTGGTPSGNTDTHMGDNPDNGDNPGIDLDGRVVIDEERHAELTAAETDLEDLQDEKEELEAELSAQEEQIDKVRGVYADRLAELSGLSSEIFEDKDIDVLESELEAKMDVEEGEAAEAALTGMSMPQSGDGGDGTVTDDETEEEVAELREKKEAALERGMEGAAEHYGNQLEALTGGDN